MPHIKNAQIRFRIIDRCLRNSFRPYPTKKDLREACEEALYGLAEGANICDSTIEKDMFAMKMEHDAPIAYSKKNGGYYYKDENFSINDIPLSEDDLNSIKFAVKTLMQFRDVDLFKQFGNAIDKIVDRINIASNPTDTDISNFVQFETAISNGGSDYLAPLLTAIKDSQIVTFIYTSFISDKPKSRKVIPLLLKEYRNRWYLISFDVDKQNVITYALERMENLIISEEYGLKPSDFDPDHFFKHAIGITSGKDEPISIQFKADKVAAKYIQSQPFHISQSVIKEGKNRITFELKIINSEEFIRSIMSYGNGIEIIEPKELRDEITSRIKGMVKLYEI
ncbi:MAG: WYL domain-containing protein [Flavobacteriia bacterium]|nr:WYL domain-containing protein [Flavobacteriia bacterium]